MKAFLQRVSNEYQVEHGMDLRDYFAAQAMQGLIIRKKSYENDSFALAIHSYMIADAMMKAREQ